jgi:hypothetical protein
VSLFLIKNHATKAYGEVVRWLYEIIVSAQYNRKMISCTARPIYPGILIQQEAGLILERSGGSGEETNLLTSTGNRTTMHSVL